MKLTHVFSRIGMGLVSVVLLFSVGLNSDMALAASSVPRVSNPTKFSESTSQTLERVMPTVVNIVAQRSAQRHSEVGNSPLVSVGSGVIIDAEQGHIVTNAHLVQGAKIISVTLSHGQVYKARCLGVDEEIDLALLKIPAHDLKSLPFGNSDALKVGDSVVAIGSPFGLKQTVTAGIISALQRTGFGMERFEHFIQTDASINPGNSGGALINKKGELIGINTGLLAPGYAHTGFAANVGIGFAIPINIVKSILEQIIQYGSVHRGWIGVLAQDLTPNIAEIISLPKRSKGAIITRVIGRSPAEKAGLRTGDVIQELNGQRIHTSGQLKNATGTARIGDTLKIKFLQNGRKREASVQIEDPNVSEKQSESQDPFLYGLGLRNFDCLVGKHGHIQGVEVMRVEEDSLAWHAGIRPGEIILMANRSETKTIEQLQAITKTAKDRLLMNVVSLQGARFVVIET